MKQNLLEQLDRLNEEIGDVTEVIEKSEQFLKFSEYLTSRHTESNIVCDINSYKNITSVDSAGVITVADNLLQIRYTRHRGGKESISMDISE
jgi:hypothetical protein